MVDVLEGLKVRQLACLDQGFVRLHEVSPRIVPEGRSIEFAIVENARLSYGSAALRSIKEDARLVSYLVEHQHTSPLEVVRFTFHIKCPLFVAVHFLRHRTASVNQTSHRYTPVKQGEFYKLSTDAQFSIRKQDMSNRQGSIPNEETASSSQGGPVLDKVKETELLLSKIFVCYEELIGMGVARETARFCLPQATYTELSYTMDLHNFLKMIKLRTDPGAQAETRIYAQAMMKLVQPLLPIVYPAFQNFILNSIVVTQEEAEAMRQGQQQQLSPSASERVNQQYRQKLQLLGLVGLFPSSSSNYHAPSNKVP